MNALKNFENLKNLRSPRYLAKSLWSFLAHYARTFAFLIAIALVGWCIYLWQITIYHAQWDDNQKQTYIKDKGQGISFNEKGFEYDIAAIKARSDENQKDLGDLADIFRLKQAPPPAVPTDKAATKPAVTKPATVSTTQTVSPASAATTPVAVAAIPAKTISGNKE